MSEARLEAQKIIDLTAEIESAREALREDGSPGARERLAAAETAYRSYLVGLNGLDGDCRWPAPPW